MHRTATQKYDPSESYGITVILKIGNAMLFKTMQWMGIALQQKTIQYWAVLGGTWWYWWNWGVLVVLVLVVLVVVVLVVKVLVVVVLDGSGTGGGGTGCNYSIICPSSTATVRR